jgi:aerobic C4-dicarboxylate transport protein
MQISAAINDMQALNKDKAKGPIYKNLTFQVLFAIVLGILFGYAFPESGVEMKILGDGFIKLIKMVIAPVIFVTVIHGIASFNDMKKFGKIGLSVLIYFQVMTALALLLGMIAVNVFAPGKDMDMSSFNTEGFDASAYVKPQSEKHGFVDFVYNIIPNSFVQAFSGDSLLQVLFLAIMFGIAIAKMGDQKHKVLHAFEQVNDILFRIIAMIMKVAPIGAFGAMAFTIGKFGLGTLIPLLELVLVACLAMAVFVFVVLGAALRYYGMSIFKLLRYVKDEILIVLGTSSSETVLPKLMEKLQKLGCSKPIVGLVLPTGYSFNLDGTAIYLSLSALFLAQAFGQELALGEQLYILAILLITSKGAAAVTGSGFIVLAATISATGFVPLEGLALLLGIDRFMSSVRAITNLAGNAAATVIMAKYQGEFDENQAKETYRTQFHIPEGEKVTL